MGSFIEPNDGLGVGFHQLIVEVKAQVLTNWMFKMDGGSLVTADRSQDPNASI